MPMRDNYSERIKCLKPFYIFKSVLNQEKIKDWGTFKVEWPGAQWWDEGDFQQDDKLFLNSSISFLTLCVTPLPLKGSILIDHPRGSLGLLLKQETTNVVAADEWCFWGWCWFLSCRINIRNLWDVMWSTSICMRDSLHEVACRYYIIFPLFDIWCKKLG
jgi:hypothetical protein